MKTLLITGGVLLSVLPAAALDVSSLKTAGKTETNGCSGTTFQTSPVTMQAVYVGSSCPSGSYFNVENNATIDSNGQVTGAGCETCTTGHYCAGVSEVTVNNGTLSTQGIEECAAGTYSNTTGLSECTPCAGGTYNTQTGQTSCTNAQAGYYTPNTTSEAQCPLGYRDGAAGSGTSINACSKTISCPASCSNFRNTASCSIDDTLDGTSVTFGNNINGYCFETIATNSTTGKLECNPGYGEINAYQWVIDNSGRMVSYSNCSIDGQHGTSCNTQERGTIIWKTAAADTTAPFAELHAIAKCSAVAPANNVYHVADNTNGFNNPGAYCWLKIVDFPGQEWMIGGPGFNDQAECEATCGVMMASNTYPFGDIDPQTNQYAVNQNALFSFSVMADLTENDSTAKVCAANTVTINWGDVANAGDAATCTYGGDLVAPAAPTPAAGYKFIGWKVQE